VLQAMLPHFSDVHAYLSNQGDMLLIATPHGKLPALGDPATKDPQLSVELRRFAMETSERLSMFALMDKPGLAALAALSALPANSDYFPILQLRAPEARFTKAMAIELSGLQISTLPLLEVVAGYVPTPASANLSDVVTSVRRDVPLRAARAYRKALLENAPVGGAETDDSIVDRLEALRRPVRSCDGFVGRKWADESTSIAGATIPYLRAADLEGIWINPAWVPACAESDPLASRVLDLYAAISSRDWKRVAELGTALLASGDVRGLTRLEPYVLRSTELAFLALGETGAVSEIEHRFGAGTRSDGFERSFMMAKADVDARAARTKEPPAPPAVALTPEK